MQELSIHQLLSQSRISQIHNAYLYGTFKNVTQAGKYILKTLSIAGDGTQERRAILRELWEYHRRLKTHEIPF
jgi:hypothetical protein